MSNEEDFDQPVNAGPWITKFSNITLTSRYIDCHVYFMRNSCLSTILKESMPIDLDYRKFTSLKADFVPYMLSLQCSMTSGEGPKCMAYLLPHGNATVSAHVNNLGAYLEINKSVLKCLPRISPLIYTGRVFDQQTTGIHTNESLVAVDAEIGDRVIIKRSVVGRLCKIGEKTNIQGSVIMERSTIGQGVRMTQSIICPGVVIGDNAELVNVIVAKEQKISANGKPRKLLLCQGNQFKVHGSQTKRARLHMKMKNDTPDITGRKEERVANMTYRRADNHLADSKIRNHAIDTKCS
ncbi:hypothetical protein DICVIV_11827 [Dictyocaulus viviparus]|uniref:EIF2B subunit epsilon/gamma LbH domain-containing protein n=1 Tax=Dictyocaulus viviparus TaxID=29172 RepID=A0A0D8XEN6_DICVI|nr:hypothetical protein DICVIV_11827 [Dictyocaulus viviparus]